MGSNSRLAAHVKRLRVAACLTQEQLAARAGISWRSLSAVESSTGNPSLATIDALAQALGTSASVLLSEASMIDASDK